MKKTAVFLMVCILLFGLIACGSAQFESQDEMFQYLNGIWRTENVQESSYYVFDNGKVYLFRESVFCDEAEQYLQTVLARDGQEAAAQAEYENMLEAVAAERIFGEAIGDVSANPQEGLMILQAGTPHEQRIVIEEDAVGVQAAAGESNILLTKLSDRPDFSGEVFSQRFAQIKKDLLDPEAQQPKPEDTEPATEENTEPSETQGNTVPTSNSGGSGYAGVVGEFDPFEDPEPTETHGNVTETEPTESETTAPATSSNAPSPGDMGEFDSFE